MAKYAIDSKNQPDKTQECLVKVTANCCAFLSDMLLTVVFTGSGIISGMGMLPVLLQ